MIKRILVNLILIVILFGFIEYGSFVLAKKQNVIYKQKADRLEVNNTRAFKTNYNILSDFNTTVWRNSFYLENTEKKPIIWFGCSFAEGAGLEDEHTPCYKISKLTNRSCINRSKGATGTQFMYYQLNNPDFKNHAPQADYIIYVFIWNHLQRLYNFQVNPLINMFNLRYKIKNDELVEIKPLFKPLYSLYSVKWLLNKKGYKQADKEYGEFTLFNKIMQESAKLTKQYYPDSKFILLEFPDVHNKLIPDYEVKKLESFGIHVVNVKKLTGDINVYDKKYWLADDIHPSEDLWNIILPELVKRELSE